MDRRGTPGPGTEEGTDRALGAVATPPELASRLVRGLEPVERVLDPACGEGELLGAVLEAWGSRGRRLELHGIELDPRRAARCRRRLGRALAGRAGGSRRVVTGDALEDGRIWPGGPGTLIVANPPWVSLSGRQAARGVRARDPVGGGWPSLHGAFLARIADRLAAWGGGARARVLIPAAVCDRQGYGKLRSYLAARVGVRTLELLPQGSFPGVVESAALLDLEAGAGAQSPAGARDQGWIGAQQDELVPRLEPFPTLPPASFGDPGVHTGNAARDLVRRDPSAAGAPLREGRDLAPFRLGPPSARLAVDHRPQAGQRFRIGPLERYARVPILLRQTADRPRAALHRDPTYFRNSLLACRPPEGLDPAFVVGVLNAATATRWHRARFIESRQRAFPQVKVGHLRTQRFPFLARREAPALHDEVARVARSLEEGAADDGHLDRLVAEAFGLEP